MSTVRSDLRTIDGLPLPLDVRRHPTARRITLRIDQRRQCLRLVHPVGVSERRALAWAQGQRDWVRRQLDAHGDDIVLEPGAVIPFEGHPHVLHADPATPRTVRVENGRIFVGGPIDGFAGRLSRWLRAEARRRLEGETQLFAARAQVTIAGVQVGDAATRWGSCSSDGRLRFSWRLLLVPQEVRHYVVAHEVAHRLHMDHGPQFKAAEREILGRDPAPFRAELRRLAPALRRVRLP